MNGFILLLLCSLLCCFVISSGKDTLAANDTLRDGDTIISVGSVFELGFISPGSSKYRYLGIWYKKRATGTIIWLANREKPLTDGSGLLKFGSEGNLVLLNGTGSIIWSSNSTKSVNNPMAQLLDTGNFVVRTANDPDPENIFWQSFDFPDNNLISGMKIGKNLAIGRDWSYNSWKSNDDPSPGNFKAELDISGYPQIFITNGSTMYFRTGPWNGVGFNGVPALSPNELYEFVSNQEEIYYIYKVIDSSVLMKITVELDGQVRRYTWSDQSNTWLPNINLQIDQCGVYARCGPYSSCNINNSSLCECLDRYKPQNEGAWRNSDFSHGCVPETPFNCSKRDDFQKYSDKKLPDTRNSTYDLNISLEKCKSMCLKNCSCTAYARSNINGKASGCFLWFGELVDIRDQGQSGQDLYVRIAYSGSGASSRFRTKTLILIVILPICVLSLIVVLGCYLSHVYRYRKQDREEESKPSGEDYGREDLLLFDFKTIANATDNFALSCKLGEGGFGPVYKGTLVDGQEIAVKRLSTSSTQGVEEFKNEVSCIAKLQHRNLVKLLGWSTEEPERMLIYEYLPNKSLDTFIFGDIKRRAYLDWPKRYDIINGIARGLLYLHQDSRLRIIHRDLKASNILLDYEMNPRISDFGTARCFGGGEIETNTARVVGTYGYMSPEYALEGVFSIKSDVYSFGVLVIEIVSGRKTRFFTHPDHNLNLLGHAWTLYNEDKLLELLDESFFHSIDLFEVFRAIQIGLLCVQQYPEDRPNMSNVLMMLSSKILLPHPKQPGFFTERKLDKAFFSPSKESDSASSTQTVSFFAPR